MLAKTGNFDIKDFKQLDKIGKGAFSHTYKIENKKTRKIYAAKIFRDLIEENTKDYSSILRQVSKKINKYIWNCFSHAISSFKQHFTQRSKTE